MWQVEFFADEGEDGECLPMLSGEAAQSVFDGDYDEIEIRQNGRKRILCMNGMRKFQLEPRLIPRKAVLRQTNGMSVNYS